MPEKKTILLLIQLPPPVHGVSTMNQKILKSKLINQNFQIILVRIFFSKSIHDLQKLRIKKILYFIKLCFEIIKKIKKYKPDIVYFSFMTTGIAFYRDLILSFIIKHILRTRIVFHLHNTLRTNFFYRFLYKRCFNGSDIIYPSVRVFEGKLKSLKLKQSRLFYLPNAINIKKYRRNVHPKQKINILYVSNLYKKKGIFWLLEVFTRLAGEHNVKLNIIGDFRHKRVKAQIERFIERKHLQQKVSLLGGLYEEEKYSYYNDSDIFVFPTLYEEAFGLVILEAMAFGLPVVASNIGSIPEIIEHKKNGLLVSPLNNKDLYECLSMLIQNPHLRNFLATNAHKDFLEKYNFESFEKKLYNILTLNTMA